MEKLKLKIEPIDDIFGQNSSKVLVRQQGLKLNVKTNVFRGV